MISPPYHLPSRLLISPSGTSSLSEPQPSTPLAEPGHTDDDVVEMSPVRMPGFAISASPLAPSLYVTPPQEHVAQFPSSNIHRAASPEPLHLPYSNLVTSPNPTHLQQQQPFSCLQTGLLPSLLAEDDSFTAKVASPAWNGKSGFDTTPPATPPSTHSWGKKHKVVKAPLPLFKPSLKLLFSLSTKGDFLSLLVPACIFSCAAGMIPPLMTFVLGDAFDAFARYQQSNGSRGAGDTLKKDMFTVGIKLIVLGFMAVVFTTVALALWVWHGERVAKRVRTAVYAGISKKPLSWFDLGMGKRNTTASPTDDDEDSEENESSGGLMGRFARETDDVRMALSAVGGRVTIAICTFVACLIIAFMHSWALTLVILAAAPLIIIVTVVVEVLVAPIMMLERNMNASVAARVERTTSAIATVKALNAEAREETEFIAVTQKARQAYNRITMLWGIRAGFVQFLLLAMFVSGFWFGNYLVITGKNSAGDVTIVFWATLLASSNMQMIMPMLNIIDKAKISMAALLETAHDTDAGENEPHYSTSSNGSGSPDLTAQCMHSSPIISQAAATIGPDQKSHRHWTSRNLNDVKSERDGQAYTHTPIKFTGELVLKNVTFYYPSRPAPAPPALTNVSIFLPAKDTTYIVGGSGSGKSTIGCLLLGLYRPDRGIIEADEVNTERLENKWLRTQIGMVSQGASVIFDGTIHDNVALGAVGTSGTGMRKPADVRRDEVISACKAAHLHEFVRNLPDGYDTVLSGERGASLSGGQRQRLAIARAYVRNPTVLILDEAISALDLASRQAVTASVKQWRKNKTTIIITHDLSPIGADDFVYVMKDGQVCEEGYRSELEAKSDGTFKQLVDLQSLSNPVDCDDIDAYYVNSETLQAPMSTASVLLQPAFATPSSNRSSIVAPNGLSDLGDHFRMFQANKRASDAYMDEQSIRRSSYYSPAKSVGTITNPPQRMDSLVPTNGLYATPVGKTNLRPPSMHRGPSSQTIYSARSTPSRRSLAVPSGQQSRSAQPSRHRSFGPRESWMQLEEVKIDPLKPEMATDRGLKQLADTGAVSPPSLTQIFRLVLPQVPNKVGFVVGLVCCVGSGICTPFFSQLLASLLAALSSPGSINLIRTALILLLIAGINGLMDWWKYTILQHVAMGWIVKTQKIAYGNVIHQDKAWYDQPDNAPINLVSKLIKDAEDARNIIGYVAGNLTVIFSMLIMGVVWAFVIGWQLTLVGLSLGPLFALSTAASTKILGAYERQNKIERHDCAKRFYHTVVNIKAIRSMSLEPVFIEKFDQSIQEAYIGGRKSAFFTGFGTGIAFFVIYIAQAIMFMVGAIFIAQGLYTFEQVLQVFVLLIFSVTFATQVLSNIPQITKAKYAAIDLLQIQKLSQVTSESHGRMTFPVQGHIFFDKVTFSYPTRLGATVLDNVSFEIKSGEITGIVGSSGSGKSTIVVLLQRLYEPGFGTIRIDGRPLSRIDVTYLRDHIGVISQHPALFDMSVSENISYGAGVNVSQADIERAAKQAHVHEFIISLPNGYDTHLGENAGLISGGQAQRLQIARALVRPREILLGDEITSALDAENQDLVMKTIMEIAKSQTTILVTHKLATMKMCDRLVVLEDGKVVQIGTFDELIRDPKGVLAEMAGEIHA